MTILNTTFFVEETLLKDFLRWLRDVYVKAAMATGVFTSHRVARVLNEGEPGVVSVACELRGDSLSECARWHDDTASLLRDNMHSIWGQRVMYFTSYLQEIELE